MTCEDVMRAALKKAKTDLAALLPRPDQAAIADWPVATREDAECLQSAYIAICDALDDVSQPAD